MRRYRYREISHWLTQCQIKLDIVWYNPFPKHLQLLREIWAGKETISHLKASIIAQQTIKDIISSVSDADQKKVYTDHWQSAWQHMSKNPGNILQNTTRTFMPPFIKMLTGNLELLNYKHCTLWNSWRIKMPNLKHYYLAGSLTEINPVVKENLLYTKWRYRERWQVEMGFSSKSSCYCSQKISVCHYAIKLVACWLVDNVRDTGKRDPLITPITESISRSWVDGNAGSSPTESLILYPELFSQPPAYTICSSYYLIECEGSCHQACFDLIC